MAPAVEFERAWAQGELGVVADRPAAAMVAALLLVSRTYLDAQRGAVTLRRTADEDARSLDIGLPADLPLTMLVDQVAQQLTAGVDWLATPDTGDTTTLAQPDVRVTVTTDPPAVRATISVPAGTGDADSAERLLGHLGEALDRLRTDPAATVGDVDVRTVIERNLLEAVNATWSPGAPDTTVVDLFLTRARTDGSAVAVVHDRTAMTYAELERASAGLAARLATLGAGPGSKVALLLGKGVELVVSMLAALRAGAAYVPIDPASPALRRDQLLRGANTAVLVTDRPVEAPDGVGLVDLTTPAADPGETPVVALRQADPAYVMYTSGSTGTPKGVVVSHHAVVSRVLGADYAPLGPATKLLQVGSVAFDATTFEIWGPLVHGGTVVFPNDDVPTPESLRAAVRRHDANTMFLTTALFNQLVDVDPACLNGCTVLVGGEANSPTHLARAFEGCPDATFVHVYGPTENTTFSTSYRLEQAPTESVPIGRPVARSTAYVMSREGRPQPVGVPGELWVGGAGVADGYLGLPELTAERFPATPDGTGARCYRTGDIARWSAGMQLEFVGRLDTQVKLRGFRIELGEIETHLRQCDGIRDAAVVVHQSGASILSAFFTATTPVDQVDVKRRLSERLPEYMVPSRYEQLDTLPLTANNKVNRGELARRRPAVPRDLAATADPGAPALLDHVSRVFAEVLDVPTVAPTDNFFDLGGHSLLAMRVWSRLRAELGLDFELRHIIDSPTVAELASVLARPETAGRQRPRLGFGDTRNRPVPPIPDGS